jgi:hypothetical protein
MSMNSTPLSLGHLPLTRGEKLPSFRRRFFVEIKGVEPFL